MTVQEVFLSSMITEGLAALVRVRKRTVWDYANHPLLCRIAYETTEYYLPAEGVNQ